jgi:hypothetical protein
MGQDIEKILKNVSSPVNMPERKQQSPNKVLSKECLKGFDYIFCKVQRFSFLAEMTYPGQIKVTVRRGRRATRNKIKLYKIEKAVTDVAAFFFDLVYFIGPEDVRSILSQTTL